MKIIKSQVLIRLVNSYLIDSPQPSNISYMWNFGSLLGLCLILQILTGVFLAMHYQPHADFAFDSVEHIMRDINQGWLLRYCHANVASFFFIFVYAHIGRALYFGSYRGPRILPYSIGVIILVLMMGTAFLGYKYIAQYDLNIIFEENIKTKYNMSISAYFNTGCVAVARNLFIYPWLRSSNQLRTRIFELDNLFFPSSIFKKYRYLYFNRLLFSTLNRVTINSNEKEIKENIVNINKAYPCSAAQWAGSCSAARSEGGTINFFSSVSNTVSEFLIDHQINAVFIFENLESETTKTELKEKTKNLSGVYLILNKITLDFYIGSASTNKF